MARHTLNFINMPRYDQNRNKNFITTRCVITWKFFGVTRLIDIYESDINLSKKKNREMLFIIYSKKLTNFYRSETTNKYISRTALLLSCSNEISQIADARIPEWNFPVATPISIYCAGRSFNIDLLHRSQQRVYCRGLSPDLRATSRARLRKDSLNAVIPFIRLISVFPLVARSAF